MKYYFITIIVVTILLVSCGSKNMKKEITKNDPLEVENTKNKTIEDLGSKFPTIIFTLKEGSTFFKPELRDSGIFALKVAAALLNSQEFRDSISKYNFPCKNYGLQCSQKCNDCNSDNISIQEIFDSLYRETNVALKLELKGCGGNTYGETSENSYFISSCYYTIYDDKKIPFTYCYADHICHEYMHNVGFYHHQKAKKRIRNKDIAEKTGWIAYDILVRWCKAGIKPF